MEVPFPDDTIDVEKRAMENDSKLREHLRAVLSGSGAHVDFEKATANLPVKLRRARPPKLSHTPWRLIEHMRIAQWDILQFTIDPNHSSPEFPDGYWPQGDTPPDLEAWDRSITAFHTDLRAMIALVTDPDTNLFTPLPHGHGQTIFREALLVADHNAYHLGQLVIVRKLLDAWNDE